MTERLGFVASVDRFLDGEDDLAHRA
jgi:hypothetical protein